MRLYDKLYAAPGTITDEVMNGALSHFYKRLKDAQCFVLTEEVSDACLSIYQSKPSSILSARSMIRTPYPKTWIEWEPSKRPKLRDNSKPQPQRVGALLDTSETCDFGVMYLCWSHDMKDPIDLTLNPLGVIFNWSDDETPVIKRYAEVTGLDKKINPDDLIANRVKGIQYLQKTTGTRWRKMLDVNDTERAAALALDLRSHIIPHPSCYEYIDRYQCYPGTSYGESLIDDLAGELPFLEAFLLLLNSRNTIVERKREDFTKLNKARASRKRLPLKEFTVTSIKLSKVQSNRINAQGGDRTAADPHLVRGHFKLRKSGVYWWSPHIRGQGGEVQRREYRVI